VKVAIIGGRYKNEVQFNRIAASAGHELEMQGGDVHGAGVLEIRRILARSDVAVILTDVNSHAAMHVAKACAKQLGTPTLVVRRLGTARLRNLLDALSRRQALGWIWPQTELEAL
jgi:hypothetical protein